MRRRRGVCLAAFFAAAGCRDGGTARVLGASAGSAGAASAGASGTASGGTRGAPDLGPIPDCDPGTGPCPCGTIGCPCATGGACDQGTCDPFSRTCILVEDGMVFVPGGPFFMGCLEGQDADDYTGPCPQDALPFREVTLDPFWIDRTEVTKAQYRACIDAGACSKPLFWDQEWCRLNPTRDDVTFVPAAPDMPAASINWTQAAEFCAWAGKRLPTEAEWEKAARGTDARKYPWGNTEPTCELANHILYDPASKEVRPCPWDYTDTIEPPGAFRSCTIIPVGYLPKGTSPDGALDMAGNVKEWVSDGYQWGVGYEDLPAENPTGVPSDEYRVFRGGSFMYKSVSVSAYGLSTSFRNFAGIADEILDRDQGFRCARDG